MQDDQSIIFEAAKKAIGSALSKNLKALVTLKNRPIAKPAQISLVSRQIKVLETSLQVLAQTSLPIPIEDLSEVREMLPGLIRKIEAVLPKFREGSPQYTLAVRRIEAFRLVLVLCNRALSE